MKNLKALAILSLLVLSSGALFAQKKSDVKPEGTWTYSAMDAPYEYSKGDLVISLEGKELQGELVFSESYKVALQEIKLKDDSLTFKAYIEGYLITSKIGITKDEMKGEVTSPEGIIGFSANRKQK